MQASSTLVLGAGVIGLSVAEALAVRGIRVTVLERRSPGRGASQASAGILAPFTEAIRHGRLLDMGRDSLGLYDAYIQRLNASAGTSIEYARAGTLQIALDDDERRVLLDAKAWLDADGEAAEWLEGSALRSFDASVTPAALGGLLVRRHGHVGVASLMNALLQSARLSGAVFEDGVDVVAIEPSSSHVVVKTRTGRQYTADTVVVATGSWTGALRVKGAAGTAMKPIKGELLHLRAPEGALPRQVVWGPRCYAVPWTDGSLLVGATAEDVGFDERPTVAGVQALTAAVTELLPACADATVEAVRVGLRPQSADGAPVIGPLPGAPRVVMATGHYRNGILLAPLTAQMVVRCVAGEERSDLT